jgi:hypothetical protein
MAGASVVSEWVELGKSFKCTITWTATSNVASVALPDTTGLLLYTLETKPHGHTYNVTIVDALGTDLLSGAGAARSATVYEIVAASPTPVSPGALTFTIDTATDSEVATAVVTFLMNK